MDSITNLFSGKTANRLPMAVKTHRHDDITPKDYPVDVTFGKGLSDRVADLAISRNPAFLGAMESIFHGDDQTAIKRLRMIIQAND